MESPLVFQPLFDIAVDEFKCFPKEWCVGQGGCEYADIVPLLQNLKGWPEMYVENPTHLQHF